MAPEPFVWGRGGSKKTPEQVAREREIADALMAQGVDFSPVADPLQGLARVATAAAGAYRGYKADKAEQEGRKGATAEIAKLLSGGGGMPATGQPAANPTPSMGGDMSAYAEAIAKKESGGNYKALGPVLNSGSYAGDRAYGKYQVMGKNIPEWTQAALGRSLTPEEFLADPAIQDAVFNHRFGSYVQKYGNPQDAASAWFTGGPLKGNENKRDVLGTTAQNYVDSFTQNLGGASPSVVTGGQGMAPQPQPQGGGMDDIAALLPALENEWLSDGQRMVLQAMLEQKMKAGQPVDPIEVNGRLVNPQTGQVVADFSDPKTATVGNALIDVRTGKPIYEAPAKEPTTDDLNEYNFARQQGYDGTFPDYMKEMKAAGATRVDARNMGNIPPGYEVEYDQAGNPVRMRPIPGSPAEAEAAAAARKQENAETRTQTTGNIVVDDIDRALKTMEDATLPVTGTFGNMLSGVGGTAASDVKALLDTVKANVGFEQLNQMRQASPTGGALGAVSDTEIRLLSSVIASLEQSQSPEQFADNLRRVKNTYLDIIHGPNGGPEREKLTYKSDAAPSGDMDAAVQSTIDRARDAIAKGADPEAVKKRLMDAGIDPSGL